MTPRACSLYDSIKLKKLRLGYVEAASFKSSRGFYELVWSGWITISWVREHKRAPVVEYIELLR